MNFDDLQRTWQAGNAAAPQPPVDAELLTDVRRGSRKFSRMILWRDVREVAACFLVCFVFGRIAVNAEAEGSIAWPAWLAAALPLGVAAYFLADRWIMRRRLAPQGGTVRDELTRAIRAVEHQIWLLRNVLWWYILPLAMCSFLLGAQIVLFGPADMPVAIKWVVGALVVLPTGFIDWWIWQLNQKAVRKELLPRLNELEQVRDELHSGN